jgi:hypothetical protein
MHIIFLPEILEEKIPCLFKFTVEKTYHYTVDSVFALKSEVALIYDRALSGL